MRRSRLLKPDMFPFLAVLLCTMGSLIFVLLVLDRQARKMARERVAQQAALLEQQKQDNRDKEQKEQRQQEEAYQKKLKLLQQQHQQALARQKKSAEERAHLQRQMQKETTKADEAKTAIAQSQAKQKAITDQIRAANQKQKTAERTWRDIQLVNAKRDEAQNEIATEIELLQDELSRAKSKQKKEAKRWSVIPYAGVKGADRVPIYVECASKGLIFYPDRKTISGGEEELFAIRKEVLTRRDQYDPRRGNYWMLLVRPDGIARYYQFLSAIRGLSMLYGYELIDKKWELDLPLAKAGTSRTGSRPTFSGAGGSGGTRGGGGGVEMRPPRASGNRGTSQPGSKPDSRGGNPGAGRGGSSNKGTKPRQLKPAARFGDRDWELVVECSETQVRLRPSGLVVSSLNLNPGEAGARQLFETAKGLIDRQLTRLKARKIDVKPNIRFIVERDALRTYHLAYPILTGINVPKTAVMKEE